MEVRYKSGNLVEMLINKLLIRIVGDIIAVVFVICLFAFNKEFELSFSRISDKPLGLLVIAMLTIGGVIDIRTLLRWNNVRNNAMQCWVAVDNEKVYGVTAADMHIAQSTQYFEIKLSEIRSVDCAEINIKKFEYYTLYIHHSHGTIKLTADQPRMISEQIAKAKAKV